MRRNARRQALAKHLKHVSEEARDLRRTLLKTYAGERLRKVFDWALSSGVGDDDVSKYLSTLTVMEQRLYYTGASAVVALEEWKQFGNRRLLMGVTRANSATVPSLMSQTSDASDASRKRHVTLGDEGIPMGQRRRMQ
jgi:hypothetical protein